jgi:serine/threonine protein kinase
MAPEYLKDGVITFKADIFSLGVIILEVISGKERRTENVRVYVWGCLFHLLLQVS